MEVFESRGMTVCEEALKKLKNSKKKSVKAILYINGDGLRVVDYETKGLLLDQTIEKVSFCAPDHNYERGFSYICRDGTTRRWICHGFMAVKETVSILSATPTTPSFVSLSIKIIVNDIYEKEETQANQFSDSPLVYKLEFFFLMFVPLPLYFKSSKMK